MKTKLIGLLITRDAMTKVPTSVPEYEIPVAQTVFGADNVEITGDTGDLADIEPAEEGKRLASKWGERAVAEAFGGANFTGRIAQEAKAHEYTERAGKKAKEGEAA